MYTNEPDDGVRAVCALSKRKRMTIFDATFNSRKIYDQILS